MNESRVTYAVLTFVLLFAAMIVVLTHDFWPAWLSARLIATP